MERREARWIGVVMAAALTMGWACEPDSSPTPLRTFVNRAEDLPADLRKAFVAFAFEYPSDWVVSPDATRGGMFVRLTSPAEVGAAPTEAIAIYPFHGIRQTDLARELDAWSTAVRQIHGFERTREEAIEVAGRATPSVLLDELRGPKGESIWGRVVLVPIGVEAGGGLRGLVIEMTGSSLAPGLDGPQDLGRTGGTASVVRNLRAFVDDREEWVPEPVEDRISK